MPAEPARYLDGVPTNLPGAAYDALEWLRWLSRASEEGRVRLVRPECLTGCLVTLEKALQPHLPAVFERTVTEGENNDPED